MDDHSNTGYTILTFNEVKKRKFWVSKMVVFCRTQEKILPFKWQEYLTNAGHVTRVCVCVCEV